jgi:hypothetical protein
MLVGGWVVAAALALVLGLQGISSVSDSLSAHRTTPLSPASVRAALQRTEAESSSSKDSDESSASESTESSASSDAASNDRSSSGGPAATPSGSVPGPSNPLEQHSDDDSVPPPSTQAAPIDKTYELIGGTVAVRFENGGAHLLWAQPKDGYDTETSGSDSHVDVTFEQQTGSHRSRLIAWWDNGPQQEIREEDH